LLNKTQDTELNTDTHAQPNRKHIACDSLKNTLNYTTQRQTETEHNQKHFKMDMTHC